MQRCTVHTTSTGLPSGESGQKQAENTCTARGQRSLATAQVPVVVAAGSRRESKTAASGVKAKDRLLDWNRRAPTPKTGITYHFELKCSLYKGRDSARELHWLPSNDREAKLALAAK